jgi:hypothetical protein
MENYVGMTRFAWAIVLPEFFKNLVWYARKVIIRNKNPTTTA